MSVPSIEESLLELHSAKIKFLQDDIEIIMLELQSIRIENESLRTSVTKNRLEIQEMNTRMDKLLYALQNITV